MDAGAILKTSAKAYTITLDNRAFRNLERELGKPFLAVRDSIGDWSAVLLAGLKKHHPEATMDTADEIIDDIGYEAVIKLLGEVLEKSPPFRRRSSTDSGGMPS